MKTGRGLLIGLILSAFLLSACSARQENSSAAYSIPEQQAQETPVPSEAAAPEIPSEEDTSMEMKLMIGDQEVSVAWESNQAVDALRELLRDEPLTVQLAMYGGFEQVGPIGHSLPREDVQTTTSAGDIVLYSGNQIVVFYGSNSWAYTRLGHITDRDAEGMKALLGQGDVELTLSLEQ